MTGEFPTRRQAALLAAAFAVLGLLPQALSRTLPDIAFPLWAADRMQHGARLYVDILEINPPLFIWLDLPLTWLSRVTSLGSITWYRIATSLLLFVSLAGCWWALEKSLGDEPPAYRRLLWLAGAFALLLLPRLDWGEREHLSLALTLPYILLGIARARGRSVPRSGAILAGIAAGVGIAFKPHFVLVWFGRELAARRLGGSARGDMSSRAKRGILPAWLRNRASRSFAALRMTHASSRVPYPETVTVPLVCVTYLISVILLHPEYFHLVRELGWAYSRFLRNSVWITLFLGDGSAIVLGALIVVLALRRMPRHAAVWRVLAWSMLGYFLAAVVQAKGWRYHFYPALGLAMLLFAAMAWDVWRPKVMIPAQAGIHWITRLFGAMPAAALVTAVLVSAALAGRQIAQPLDPRYDPDPSIGQLIPLVKARAAGRPVFILSPNMASGFPLTNYAGSEWPSRFSHMWLAVVAYDSATKAAGPVRYRPPENMGVAERFGLRTTVADFLRSRSPLVLSLIAVDQPGWGMQRLDMIRFLERDTAFRAAWQAYDSLGQVGNYTVWGRRGDAVAAAPLPAAVPLSAGGGGPPDDVRVNPAGLAAALVFLVVLAFAYRQPTIA